MHLQSFPCSLFSYRKRLVHKKERFILCSVKAPSSCLPRQMLLVKYWTLNRKKKQLWAYFATSTAFLLVFDICNIVPWNLWQEVEKQAGLEKKAKRKNSPSYKTLEKHLHCQQLFQNFPFLQKNEIRGLARWAVSDHKVMLQNWKELIWMSLRPQAIQTREHKYFLNTVLLSLVKAIKIPCYFQHLH